MILIHSTHEAGVKLGGIGAVLDGLLSAPSYLAQVDRTILVGPMNTRDATEMERLFAPRNRLRLRYFPARGVADCSPELAAQLRAIETQWGVRLLYGTRAFVDAAAPGAARGSARGANPAEHEVLLVDPAGILPERLNRFKHLVWQRFGLDCQRYENEHEFELYMSIGQPAFEALRAILEFRLPISDSDVTDASARAQSQIENPESEIMLCHEFMGLPLWYAADLAQPGAYKSAYVAHEVPTARALVENDRGHDTRFYNVMERAQRAGLDMEDVFGDQSAFFKHALLKTATQCTHVLAVGDLVVDELRFADDRFQLKKIDLVYNGVPSRQVFLPEYRASNQKLKVYARALTGAQPTFVFSHVTRMIISKGLWRDLRVMEELDPLLAARNESAVLFMLTSVAPQGRSSADAQRMAREYGWPRQHREGWPDLVAWEAALWPAIAGFNATARASQIVLINQYGFSRDRCGESMPADLQFDDLRRGTDLEFGQSIYEPFGIAQLEPLSSGALCAMSNVCGCLGFSRSRLKEDPRCFLVETGGGDATQAGIGLGGEDRRPFLNLVVADYTTLPREPKNTSGWRAALNIGQAERDVVERRAAREAAQAIAARLPRDDREKNALIESGYLLAQQMAWDVVAREQLLPALTR